MKTKTSYNIYILAAIIVVAVGALLMHRIAPTTAQSVQQLEGEISQLENRIQDSKERLQELRSREDTLENKLEIIRTDIDKKEAELRQTRQEISTTEAEIRKTEKKLQRQKELMQENATTLYKEGDPSTLEMLFSSDNFSDFIDRKQYLDNIKSSLDEAAKKVKQLQQKLKDEKATLEEKRQKQENKKQQLQSRRNEQQRLLERTQGQEAEYQELLSRLKRRHEKVQKALKRLNLSNVVSEGPVSAGDTIGKVGNTGFSTWYHLHFETYQNGSLKDPNTYLSNGFQRPTQGPISQSYWAYNRWYSGNRHTGIDYAPGAGAPIVAAADGILYRGCSSNLINQSGYGYMAVVDHADGVRSVYGHMKAPQNAPCNRNTFYSS